MGGCSGLERTNFWCLHLGGCGGHERTMLGNFYFRRVWCLERLDFLSFPLLKDVVVLKLLIYDNFHIWRVWWSWKYWFLSVFILEAVWQAWKDWFWIIFPLGGCCGFERTDLDYWLNWLCQITIYWITICGLSCCAFVCVCVYRLSQRGEFLVWKPSGQLR